VFGNGLARLGNALSRGEPQPVVMVQQASRLQKTGCLQGVERGENGRAEAEAARQAIGVAPQICCDAKTGLPDSDLVTDPQAQAVENNLVGGQAPDPVLDGQRGGQVPRRLQADLAIERVETIDGLQLDQQRPIGDLQHGAHFGHVGKVASFGQPCRLLGRGIAVREAQIDIPAEKRAAVVGQSGDQGARQGADRGNRRHSEKQAKCEDAKTAEAATQLAPGEPQPQTEVRQGGHSLTVPPPPRRAAGRPPAPDDAGNVWPRPDRG
jgi:hypothetical protein